MYLQYNNLNVNTVYQLKQKTPLFCSVKSSLHHNTSETHTRLHTIPSVDEKIINSVADINLVRSALRAIAR